MQKNFQAEIKSSLQIFKNHITESQDFILKMKDILILEDCKIFPLDFKSLRITLYRNIKGSKLDSYLEKK